MMKRGFLAVFVAVSTFLLASLMVCAAEANPTVTFNSDNELVYSNFSEEDGAVSTGAAFEGVLPGESRSLTITLENANNHTTDFYLSATVMDVLEQAHNASGAVYDIRLSAGENVLYDSTIGGYVDSESTGSQAGLSAMNESLNRDVFVNTLKKGETTDVVLTITFDGEAMGSSDDSDYTSALASLDFAFKASYEDSNAVEIIDKVVIRKGDTVYKKNIVEIPDNKVPLGVKTGDETMIWVAVVALIIGIGLFLITGKRHKKNKTGMLIGAVLLAMLPSLEAEAKNVYTVTFRPGNVGHFEWTQDDITEEKTIQEKAQIVAEKMGYPYEYEVTQNGAIKVKVPAGEAMPTAPLYIAPQEGYFAKSASVWGPVSEGESVVTKNCDYVVDYGKLVDGIEYRVQFLDSADDSPIAPMVVAYANKGEVLIVDAPTKIVISGATTYNLDGEAHAEVALSEEEKVITFYYTAAPFGVVSENIIYDNRDGDIVYVDEYVVIPGQAAQGGAVLAPNQQAEAVPEVVPDEEEQPVNIEDENVPLVDTPDGETIDIEEDDVPLAASIENDGNSMALYIGLGICVALLMAVTAVWIRMNKRAKVEESNE